MEKLAAISVAVSVVFLIMLIKELIKCYKMRNMVKRTINNCLNVAKMKEREINENRIYCNNNN